MALDMPSVPDTRECAVWGRSAETPPPTPPGVASDQVDPGGGDTDTWPSGRFRRAGRGGTRRLVKKARLRGASTPSVLEPEHKYAGPVAEAQGWKVLEFQEPPISGDRLGALRRRRPRARESRPCGPPWTTASFPTSER